MSLSKEWEPYEAYTVGNRKAIGWNHFNVGSEPMNDGTHREYISAFGNDGRHFIFRPGHPHYEEMRQKAQRAEYSDAIHKLGWE